MSNIFLESFDNITTVDLALKSYTNLGVGFDIVGSGRTGSGLQCTPLTTGTQQCILKNLPASYSTLVTGFAMKTSNPMFSGASRLWSFTDNNTEQLYIKLDSIGRISFYLGNGLLIGTSSVVYSFGSYYYFEFKINFTTAATGSINFRINGVPQAAFNSVVTAITTGGCNQYRIWNPIVDGSILPTFYDDMYANDTTGPDNNDYMGDVRIFVDRPAATVAGASQWALSGPSPKAVAVGDTTQDGDATYISSNTAGQVDLYTLAAPPSGLGTVKAVQTNLVARKDDGIIRQIAPVLGNGATTNVGASVSIGNNYVDYLQSFDRNPITGAAWSVGDLSTLQVGVKEIV
ncbi:MAG: hypothetical protein JWQ02_3430 [Capsulimonas sp.]|nr:hypothetical protein [Capsulimonas sp.]